MKRAAVLVLAMLWADVAHAQVTSCRGWQDNECASGNVLNYDPSHPQSICFLDAFGSFTCSAALTWDGLNVKIQDNDNGVTSYLVSNVSSGPNAGAQFLLGNDVGGAGFILQSSGNSSGNDLTVLRASHHGITIEALDGTNGTIELNSGNSTFIVDSLAGSGTRCIQADSTGRVTATSGACGSGTGTVTVVTATPPLFITSTATTTPNVTIQGALVSGSTSTTAQNLGLIATSMLACSTAAGVCTVDGVTVGGGLAFNTGTAAETLGSFTCGANTFVSSSSTSGLACTQPSFANVSGSVTCTQLPVFTGQSTKPAGSCVTTNTAFTDAGSAAWTWSPGIAGAYQRYDVGAGSFVAAGTIAGDGTTVSTANAGIPPENLVISQIGAGKVLVSATDPTRDYLDTKLESTSANIAVTHVSGPPEFVNLNVVTAGLFDGPQTVSISTNYVTYAPTTIGYGNHSIPYATARSTADVQNDAMEVPVGFAATHQRVMAWVTSNSLSSTGGGSTSTACSPSQNGFSTSIFAGGVGGIPNTSTGLFDSGVQSVSSPATTDTWGIICGGTSPLSGSITMTVTVILYR